VIGWRATAVVALAALACAGADEGAGPASAAGSGGAAAGSGAGSGSGGTAAGSGGGSGSGGTAAGRSGASGTAGSPSEGGAAGEAVIPSGDCALAEAAFCDTFDQGPTGGGRSGELDPASWSVLRAIPSQHPDLDSGFEIGPALMPDCRPGVSGEMALPDADTVICEPTATITTRHFLGAVAAQNYGLNTYRIRQPFDFSGRTGTIAFDVDLSASGLNGWPAVAISEDPSPAPSYDFPERGSGARNGVQIDFNLGFCNTPNTILPLFYSSLDYVETAHDFSWECDQAHALTARESLNHVEIRVSRSGVEVWASDASPDGVTFPNFQRIGALALELPFERGYVSLITRNHASMKYWSGASYWTRWDNVGFDGPVIGGTREHSVPEPLGVTQGLSGCSIDGACVWRGRVIAEHPDDNTVCSSDCEAEGEGRTVGFVVPREDEPPVALEIPDVNLEGVTRARLIWGADYPWFEWNDVLEPPTALAIRYRLNGGAAHDRFISQSEANAFGGEQQGAGLLNQMVEIDAAELVSGTNVLELTGVGTWTGAYRIAVVGVDLLLDVSD
jgi:hypothetical protein